MSQAPVPMQPPRATGRPMLTLEDLTQDLVWPRLLRAGPLALHPVRVGVGLFFVAMIAVILWLVLWIESALGWSGSPEARAHLMRLLEGADAGGSTLGAAGERIVDLMFAVPIQFLRVHPLGVLIGGPLVCIASVMGMGALSRMAATEFTAGRSEGAAQAVVFARQRLGSMLGAVLGPLAAIWAIAIALAVLGFLLARWPGLNLVAAILHGAALLAGLAAMFLLFVYSLGKPLLIPAVCCDGADALDAIQRAYAYVLAKPLRLVIYLVIVIAEGVVLLALIALLCAATVSFTARAAGKWAGEDGRRMVYAQRAPETVAEDGTRTISTRHRLFNWGAGVVRSWNGIPAAIPLAFLFSYSACGATVLYLGMRRVCDGQDMNELWSPKEDREGALGAGAAASEGDADAE